MKIRMKKRGVLGVKKIALDGKIGKIEKKDGGLQIFVRGLEGLGVVGFGPREIEMIKKKIGIEERKIVKKKVAKKGKKK